MTEFKNVNLERLSIHHIGNKINDEALKLSKSNIDAFDTRLTELLIKYFLSSFTTSEFYNFSFTNGDFKLNPVYNFASAIFDNKRSLHFNSVNIAKHLYEVSSHPQIKSGDLFVVYFSDLTFEGESINAIGIFKSENRQAFLKLDSMSSDFELNYDDGINIEKLDKGCLIFEAEKEKGYKICIIDKSNKSAEAQFWKENFLMLRPCNDDYHQTKDFLDIAKNYVTKQLAEEFEVNKADQIDMLNRSMEYFRSRDNFSKKEFEKEVFQDAGIIKSFREFDDSYRSDNDIELEDSFEISVHAVKKQSRVFKSILKLDRNFHIYIHGNKDMIEQGVEKDGRKYYKIYFEKET
jgi:hypothetical protein